MNKKGLSTKAVTILVIVAIVLAGVSIAYTKYDLGSKIFTPSESNANVDNSGSGRIGVEILPGQIEDKGNE